MDEFRDFSPFDQLSNRMNIILCLFFKLSHDDQDARNAIVSRLECSLAALSAANPLLAARIQPHRSRPGRKEALLTDCVYCSTAQVDQFTYADLDANHFELPYDQFWRFLPPHRYSFVYDKPDPPSPHTMAVQVNFIAGGLVLAFDLDHVMCDGTGSGSVIQLLSHFYAGRDAGQLLTEVQLPPLSPATYSMPVEEALANGGPLDSSQDLDSMAAPGENGFGLYRFPREKLQHLKERLTLALGTGAGCPWISTLDAMVAFIWASCMQARASFLDPDLIYRLVVMVNARSRMQPPVPPGYIGNCVTGCLSWRKLPCFTTATDDVADIAASIRTGIAAVDDAGVRRTVTLVEAEEDLNRVLYSKTNPDTQFVATSWADNAIGHLDFGHELGRPEVRVFGGPGARGLCVLQPRDPSGDIKFHLSLEKAAIEKLEADPEWLCWVERLVSTGAST